MSKKPVPSADTARKIWLAGIGAYGRAFSEAQESIAKLTGDSAKIFDELVAKGEAIEKTVEARGRKVAERVAPGALSLDERIRRMRERIGLVEEPSALADELDALRARVSALETEVAALKGAGAKVATRKTAKRKSAKKAKA